VGVSPEVPKDWVKTPEVDFRTYHVPFEGRQTATSVLPSPSKSPGVGKSPGSPQLETLNVPSFVCWRYQVLLDGR
jgi:hypothetical protein